MYGVWWIFSDICFSLSYGQAHDMSFEEPYFYEHLNSTRKFS